MKTSLTILAALLFALGLAGCGDDHKGHDHGAEAHEEHDETDGHDHGDDHADEGEPIELGKLTLGAFELTVTRRGAITAGAEGVLEVEVAGDAPSAIRAWIGVASGQGSMKGKLEAHGSSYHGHVEVPAKLPEGSAIWIEVEDADGNKSASSIPLE